MTCHDRAQKFLSDLFDHLRTQIPGDHEWLRTALAAKVGELEDAFLDAYSDGGESYSTGEL